jgi:hypothetical protein
MANPGEWHGMPVNELVAKVTTSPEKPAAFKSMITTAGAVYAHVHFTGNWGLNLCGNYQEHDAYRISQDSAHQIAWSLFGSCGHKIYYYDSAGQLVLSE